MNIGEIHKVTYYYVQSLNNDNEIKTICHTKDHGEYYYKFLFEKHAKKLAEEQKKLQPDLKFRIIKCTEVYETNKWF